LQVAQKLVMFAVDAIKKLQLMGKDSKKHFAGQQ
jgi:hypothetical protein